jgi:hypothetical protein
MKIISKTLIFICLIIITSCYKESNWLDNNAEFQDKSVPFIYMYALDSATFTPGTKARVILDFYCKDPLKEIRLYESRGASITAGTRILVATFPYVPAFSQIRQMDSLVATYTIPSGDAKNTQIWLHAEGVSTKDVTKGTWVTPTASRTYRTK